MSRDWLLWHRPYTDPTSPLSRRLLSVRQQVAAAIDAAPAGTVRLLSLCAGQGHDVLGALSTHRRVDDVAARLVELDQRNVRLARATVRALGLTRVDVVCGDASSTSAVGESPVDVLLLCGIFGNVSDDDIHATIELLPSMCSANATVIWTRHRREPDLTPTIRHWFETAGFATVAFDAPDNALFTVGANRFEGVPRPLERGMRLFEFVGDGTLGHL
jgi:hypothetical protein